ncbi:MAG: hypothetical protein GC134_04075 [Proteobacteria bacterium]|nr:hypothetical protein [Pseudomonadota bacterium]
MTQSYPKVTSSPTANKAFRTLKQAAATGDVTAMRHYAIAVYGGIFVHTTSGRPYRLDADHKLAAELFGKLAEGGDARAQRYLAHCYLYGHGVDTDRDKALDLLRQAAAGGSREAEADLHNHTDDGTDAEA